MSYIKYEILYCIKDILMMGIIIHISYGISLKYIRYLINCV